MATTPITEYIAENIKTAINAITVANGFNYNLSAQRKRWVDFDSETPEDGKVLIMAKEDEKPGQPVGCAEWIQKFLLLAIVTETGLSESESIELKRSRIRDDIRKKLAEDFTRGGYAIETIHGAATPLDGSRITAIEIEVNIHYRTKFENPYTQV
jgi:hypothetical protein